MSACTTFLSSLDSGVHEECHPSFCVSPSLSALKVVLPLFHVCACTVWMCLLKQATSQHKSQIRGHWRRWKLQMRIIHLVIDYLLGSVSPGSSFSSLRSEIRGQGRSLKPARGLGARTWSGAACASTTGREASHSRVHMRPHINCFACSDSQLSQPPDSVMILLSSAFVSCCVCSCMINPPFLSSTRDLVSGRNNHPEVRSASQRKSLQR